MPSTYSDGVFVGQHGSWNRDPPAGYKVIFVPFNAGKPIGMPVDVLSGFLSPDGEAWGRPVGVAIGKDGALLVADDVGNLIWRVTATANATAPPAAPPSETVTETSPVQQAPNATPATPNAAESSAD